MGIPASGTGRSALTGRRSPRPAALERSQAEEWEVETVPDEEEVKRSVWTAAENTRERCTRWTVTSAELT